MYYHRRGQKLLVVLGTIIVMLFPTYSSEVASAPIQGQMTPQDLTQSISVSDEDKAISAGGSATNSSSLNNHKNTKGLSLSQLLHKYPETFKTSGPRNKVIALTFDDVPDPRFTPQLLNILKKYHVKATFFVVGSRAKKHPAMVKRMIREGHAIGNHSYNHPQFVKLEMNDFRTQIIKTENIIQTLAGYKPRLIRPPYGDISEQQLKWAKNHGYTLVNWNVDSLDWKGLSKNQVRNNILANVGRGAIILQHGGGGPGSHLQGTIQALPEVITIMRKRGYTFVTVPQLLQVSKSK
ncbi:polysaccharide deacetylase family protein [Paenibacillus sp. FSL R10-2734]|uniref:polysaccharide deacetylase family protein n=1 Tax=Paenibacillus sp. FSL R10-2734 TaxID=2954691 RepID=UPI0030DB8A8E